MIVTVTRPLASLSFLKTSLRAFAFIACVSLSMTASAHNVLKSSTPADGSTLDRSPSELALDFNGQVRLVKLSLKRSDESIDVGFKPDLTAATSFIVPVPELASGAYSLEFSVIGEDGHTVAGHFNFGIGMPAAHTESGH
ncbi:MAG: copper resistance protein CopC [OM182 bacterium]|jgi:methionine-rich copper-binding protein CopC|nr:copper resistance protein CopC [Gammaproteobacteria bacterium]MDB2374718.1 copper resistance protein CopC [Gammaproteobacteria bacterium]|tara:strand:- start:5263 stop:5682 length:420 start_codon:yes stop_codon:yes gene_type:complete